MEIKKMIKNMDGWMAKKYMKYIWMVEWIEKKMDGQMDRENI